jgi:hypothetical protein
VGGRLIADTELEASWAPIDELDRPLSLDGGNGALDILWNNITAVQKSASHYWKGSG